MTNKGPGSKQILMVATCTALVAIIGILTINPFVVALSVAFLIGYGYFVAKRIESEQQKLRQKLNEDAIIAQMNAGHLASPAFVTFPTIQWRNLFIMMMGYGALYALQHLPVSSVKFFFYSFMALTALPAFNMVIQALLSARAPLLALDDSGIMSCYWGRFTWDEIEGIHVEDCSTTRGPKVGRVMFKLRDNVDRHERMIGVPRPFQRLAFIGKRGILTFQVSVHRQYSLQGMDRIARTLWHNATGMDCLWSPSASPERNAAAKADAQAKAELLDTMRTIQAPGASAPTRQDLDKVTALADAAKQSADRYHDALYRDFDRQRRSGNWVLVALALFVIGSIMFAAVSTILRLSSR